MDALTLLTQQHDEAERLFACIAAADDIATKAILFEELADKLTAHARIEETVLYPAVMTRRTRELVIEFTEEHLEIKRVLADLLDLDPEDAHFDSELKALAAEVRHHAREEEERELFPRIRRLMNEEDLETLGAELARQHEEALAAAHGVMNQDVALAI